MITTFSVILSSRSSAARAAKALIIGATLVLLSSCSALRLGYDNAVQLSMWRLDSFFDLNRAQSPTVRQSLDSYFDWHRRTQLPVVVGLLAELQPVMAGPVTAEVACSWFERARQRVDPAIDRALVQASDVLPSLTEENFQALEQRYAKNMAEMRTEYLQADATERRAKRLKRTVDRAEQLYGRLNEPQRQGIAAGLSTSIFDTEVWLTERQRRQADTLQTLRRLAAEKPDRQQRIAALRELTERSQRSPDPTYRAYQQRLTQGNCMMAAQIHNATTPAQRAKAQQKLQGWEADFRSLISDPATPQ